VFVLVVHAQRRADAGSDCWQLCELAVDYVGDLGVEGWFCVVLGRGCRYGEDGVVVWGSNAVFRLWAWLNCGRRGIFRVFRASSVMACRSEGGVCCELVLAWVLVSEWSARVGRTW
jgi:hypothetical protein